MFLPRFVGAAALSIYPRHRVGDIFGFLFFSITLIIRLSQHALWRDEAQSWLIAKSATSLLDLQVFQSEGHPPLWYWTLYLFTALGSDVRLVKIPTGIFALATLAIVWFHANVRPAEKVMISASYYLSWEYGIIARSYVLGTFLLCAFAAFSQHWRRHPFAGALLLGLASLTHLFFAMAAGGIAALTVADWQREGHSLKRILALSFVLGLFLLFFAVIAIHAFPQGVSLRLAPAGSKSLSIEVVRRIGRAFTFGYSWKSAWIVSASLAVWCFLRTPLSGALFFVTAAAISLFHVLIYEKADSWHFGVIYIVFVAFYIIKSSEIVVFAGRALLILSMVDGLRALAPLPPYSAGEQAAAIIRRHNAQEGPWAAYPDFTGTVTFAVLRRPFHSFECDCELTFIDWRARSARFADLREGVPIDRRKNALRERIQRFIDASSKGDAYVLVSQPSSHFLHAALPEDVRIEKIDQTGPAVISDETFFVWRLTMVSR